MGPLLEVPLHIDMIRLACDDGLSVWSDLHCMGGEVGYGDPEQLLARLCVPHPHIVLAAGGKQISRIPIW